MIYYYSGGKMRVIDIFKDCLKIQKKKSRDYQNTKSRIKQLDYYPQGVLSIMNMIHTKTTRLWSLLESKDNPNYESLEDNAKDLINYTAFLIKYINYGFDGQDYKRNIFNEEMKNDK